jgi:hypothetical protein
LVHSSDGWSPDHLLDKNSENQNPDQKNC